MKLIRFESQTEHGLIEIFIDKKTGASFASQSGVARMSGIAESTLRSFIKVREKNPEMEDFWKLKTSKAMTNGGLQRSRLLNEAQMKVVFKHYNPNLIEGFTDLGLRKFLHTLAGYKHKEFAGGEIHEKYLETYHNVHGELKERHAGKKGHMVYNSQINKQIGVETGKRKEMTKQEKHLMILAQAASAVALDQNEDAEEMNAVWVALDGSHRALKALDYSDYPQLLPY